MLNCFRNNEYINFIYWRYGLGSWRNDDGGEKAIGFRTNKTTTLHVHHALLYISLPSLHDCNVKLPNFRGGSRIFFRRGCTRLLLYFNTNKPHSFFFSRIPVVLENHRSSQGERGAHPLHPPPRSAPEFHVLSRAGTKDNNFLFLFLNFDAAL